MTKGMHSKAKQNRLTAWAYAHPMAAGLAVAVLYVIFRRISHFVFKDLLPSSAAVTAIHEIVDVVWPFLIVVAFGQGHVYRRRGFWRTLFLGLSLILYGLFFGYVSNLVSLLQEPGLEWQTPLMALWGVITMLFVGFREESVFRGAAANILADRYLNDRRGILVTAFGSAFFFGVMHMQNVFVGQSFTESVLQSINACCLGVLFCAVYLRGGSLWAMMLIHGFIDLGLLFKNLLTRTYASDAMGFLAGNTETSIDLAETAFKLVIWAICILIALFLLRKSKCDEIIERFRAEE